MRFQSTHRLNPVALEMPPSGIREIMHEATIMEREEPDNPVIHLEVGQPNFQTPQHVIDGCVQALQSGKTGYCPNAGIFELREAVAHRFNSRYKDTKTKVENIMITSGSMLSLFTLYLTIFKPGDECLVPFPGFPNYSQGLSMVKYLIAFRFFTLVECIP